MCKMQTHNTHTRDPIASVWHLRELETLATPHADTDANEHMNLCARWRVSKDECNGEWRRIVHLRQSRCINARNSYRGLSSVGL